MVENLELSIFGKKLSEKSGILDLMNDLGEAVALRPDMLSLGGGNPAAIPELQARWRDSAASLLSNREAFDKALLCYDSPQGDPGFLNAFARLFRERFNLPIDSSNLAVVSGAQVGLFCLLNMFAGRTLDGRKRKILIPASPEYVGYADMGIDPDMFVACPAKITYPDPRNRQIFKYSVNFDAVERVVREEDIAVILVSRPTNPSGNVLRRDELARLEILAESINVPLIVDNAYGGPFPGIIEDASELDSVFWRKNTILSFSLSKIGLPSLRTGIIVASPEIVKRLSAITAIVGLANGSLGQRIAQPFFESGEILTMAREIVQPYYCKRRAVAMEFLLDALAKRGIEGRLHKSEGAFFLWLWLPELTCGTQTFYQRLKEKGVLAIPGDGFFYGINSKADGSFDQDFENSRTQMMRISFSGAGSVVNKGLEIVAETAAELMS